MNQNRYSREEFETQCKEICRALSREYFYERKMAGLSVEDSDLEKYTPEQFIVQLLMIPNELLRRLNPGELDDLRNRISHSIEFSIKNSARKNKHPVSIFLPLHEQALHQYEMSTQDCCARFCIEVLKCLNLYTQGLSEKKVAAFILRVQLGDPYSGLSESVSWYAAKFLEPDSELYRAKYGHHRFPSGPIAEKLTGIIEEYESENFTFECCGVFRERVIRCLESYGYTLDVTCASATDHADQ